jgi:hypothetical protein
MKRNMMVIRKASPHPMAANRIRVLLMRILLEYSCDAPSSSEVISSIIAVAASQMLRSVNVNGMFRSITTTVAFRPRIKCAHVLQLLLENFSSIIYKNF